MQVIIDSAERRSYALNQIKKIRGGDCPLLMTVEKYVESLSDPQRGKFHVLIREMSRITGYTEGEIKEFVKKDELGTRLVKIGNIEKEVTCSSETDDNGKKRDKPSYSQLIEAVYRIAAEAGIQI